MDDGMQIMLEHFLLTEEKTLTILDVQLYLVCSFLSGRLDGKVENIRKRRRQKKPVP